MELNSIQQLITRRYPNWNVYWEISGKCIWVSMNDKHRNFFEIQVTEDEGVGITRRREDDLINFSGHDEAFNTLEETLEYLDKNII
ncbi:hypothetical protein [Paenibacillus sedimenti]|uniref:Uncharacterized protein n=1 Tax=Paenibacillus sedimenti TaxID=2770274 RepID=A0A926KS04_9BACL|nr:hypothetical protein [Paenibacillus sedimenti]MBD0380990.1 hypothetical protein [Paenibacillus sedimenti]